MYRFRLRNERRRFSRNPSFYRNYARQHACANTILHGWIDFRVGPKRIFFEFQFRGSDLRTAVFERGEFAASLEEGSRYFYFARASYSLFFAWKFACASFYSTTRRDGTAGGIERPSAIPPCGIFRAHAANNIRLSQKDHIYLPKKLTFLFLTGLLSRTLPVFNRINAIVSLYSNQSVLCNMLRQWWI